MSTSTFENTGAFLTEEIKRALAPIGGWASVAAKGDEGEKMAVELSKYQHQHNKPVHCRYIVLMKTQLHFYWNVCTEDCHRIRKSELQTDKQ